MVAVGALTAPLSAASSLSEHSAVAGPLCTTAIAPAPALTDVTTSLTSTPGSSPFGLAVSPNGKYAFVGENGPLAVYSLTSAPPTLARVDSSGISSLIGLALSPGGRYLVAAEGSGAMVFKAAALEGKPSKASPALLGSWSTSGQGAIEAAVSPDGRYAFVTLEDSNQLAVFNLRRALAHGFRSSDLVGYVPLGIAPVGIAVSPGGRYLYVTSEATVATQQVGTLTTINLAKAERAPSHAIVSTVPAGCNPVRVVATRSAVYVTARASDAVLEFNAGALVADPDAALTESVQVGEAPVGLALVDHDRVIVVSDSNRFAATGAGSSLAVVGVSPYGGMTLAGYLPAGSFPRDMAASPNGKTLIVSNYDSNQIETVAVAGLP